MNIINYLPELLTFIAGGGLMGLFTIRQTKEGAKLDNAAKLVAEYRELLEKYKDEKEKAEQLLAEYKAKYDEQVKEFNEELASVKKELAIVKTQLETSNMLYASANALKCSKVNCTLRRPPIDMDAIEHIAGLDDNDEEEKEEE